MGPQLCSASFMLQARYDLTWRPGLHLWGMQTTPTAAPAWRQQWDKGRCCMVVSSAGELPGAACASSMQWQTVVGVNCWSTVQDPACWRLQIRHFDHTWSTCNLERTDEARSHAQQTTCQCRTKTSRIPCTTRPPVPAPIAHQHSYHVSPVPCGFSYTANTVEGPWECYHKAAEDKHVSTWTSSRSTVCRALRTPL
jgi:hypothetical protein